MKSKLQIGNVLRFRNIEKLKLEKVIVDLNVDRTVGKIEMLEQRLEKEKSMLNKHLTTQTKVDSQLAEFNLFKQHLKL